MIPVVSAIGGEIQPLQQISSAATKIVLRPKAID